MAKVKQFEDGTKGYSWATVAEQVPCLRHPMFDTHNGFTLKCRECGFIVDPRSGRVVSETKAQKLEADVFAMSQTDKRTVIAWFTRFRKNLEAEIAAEVPWHLARKHSRRIADETWPRFKAAEKKLAAA